MKMNTIIIKQKATLLKTFLCVLFVLNFSISFAQSSKVEFKVQNDRVNRSTTAKGTYYQLEITNNGQSDIYDLLSDNVNEKSTNPDGSSVRENVRLKVQFLDKNMRPISSLKVNSGETINFLAYIQVPQGTTGDKWSSNQISAQSKSNSNTKKDIVLHTVVNLSTDN